jgi:hypothetical protein
MKPKQKITSGRDFTKCLLFAFILKTKNNATPRIVRTINKITSLLKANMVLK